MIPAVSHPSSKLKVVGGALVLGLCLLLPSSVWPGVQQVQKTAGEQYKNVQVLKNVPADKLTANMLFMANSLGVNCDHCHNRADMSSDEKPTKLMAREMLKMVEGINKTTFGGRDTVTCFTCHGAKTKPMSAITIPRVDPREHIAKATVRSQPLVDEVLTKYLEAAGGRANLEKLRNRVIKGTFLMADGQSAKQELYVTTEKLLDVRTFADAKAQIGVDGQKAWRKVGDAAAADMGRFELARLRNENDIRLPLRIKDIYKDLKPVGFEVLGGREVAVLEGVTDTPNTKFNLYFDRETGLLSRIASLSASPFGWNPRTLDFFDYRTVDGVKVPYVMRMSWPHTWQARVASEISQNEEIDEKIFEVPK